MKISKNMSHGAFAWQLRIFRAFAVVLLILAVVNRRHFIDWLACAGVVWLVILTLSDRRSNVLLEVHDCGDYLRLELDGEELVVNLYEIDRAEICDGSDGPDWITMYLCFESKFGRFVEFYLDMLPLPMERPDIWVKEFNERVAASRSTRECLAQSPLPVQ